MMSSLGLPLTVAMLAGIAGFLALRLSPVPMIRDFGLMLAVGVAALFGASLLLPAAILYRRDARRAGHGRPRRVARAADRGARPHSRVETGVRFLTSVGRGRVAAAVLATVVIATIGIVVDRGTTIQSDPEGFIPQDSPVLTDLRHIRDVAGSSAEMGFLVTAPDVTRPETLEWMASFERLELARHPRELLSSASIASIASQVTGTAPTPGDVDAILGVAPVDIRKTFVSDDRTHAHLLFAIGPISLLDQKRLLAEMQADLHAPAGVKVTTGGSRSSASPRSTRSTRTAA